MAAIGGAYVDVLDDRKLVAASPSKSAANRRWRVRDNLPGTAAFCPIVRKTKDWMNAVAVDVRRLLQDLAAEYGEGELPLSDPALGDLQGEILGGLTTLKQFGLRQSPVFVGEVVRFQELVHYVAPAA